MVLVFGIGSKVSGVCSCLSARRPSAKVPRGRLFSRQWKAGQALMLSDLNAASTDLARLVSSSTANEWGLAGCNSRCATICNVHRPLNVPLASGPAFGQTGVQTTGQPRPPGPAHSLVRHFHPSIPQRGGQLLVVDLSIDDNAQMPGVGAQCQFDFAISTRGSRASATPAV